MPRNGSGQYNPLTNTWNPPVTGVLATSADFQAQLNDISAAITQSVSKDGQTPMTANLPMGNNSIVGIASGTETSPSISANGDTNTGLYFPAADTVGVAVGGVQALLIDSAGIEVPAGTAAAPSLTTTGDTNTGLYFPAADTVAIATGGVKRVEVDASGNVGVGVTPSAFGGQYRGFQIGGNPVITGANAPDFCGNAYHDGTNWRYIGTNFAARYSVNQNNSGAHTWYTAPSGTAGNAITFTQAMTLTSTGRLLRGKTSDLGYGIDNFGVNSEGLIRTAATAGGAFYFANGLDTTAVGAFGEVNAILGGGVSGDAMVYASANLRFAAGGSERARITSDGNLLVGYTTSNGAYKLQVNSQIFATSSTIATSDGRYKENIKPLNGALDMVKAFNPVQFSWKKHPVHAFDRETPTVGFIAQELEQVLVGKPFYKSIIKRNECIITPAEYETIEVTPAKEEIKDEDGNVLVAAQPAITEQRLVKPAVTEEFLGIAECNLLPILTKAIQEQQALIESLTARITALEAK